MEGESSAAALWRSNLLVTTKQEFPTGSETELLKIDNAVLSLIGFEHFPAAGVISGGAFSLRLVVQTITPILIAICVVGNVYWPITIDIPVLRIGTRSFAFAMPGFLYGLQFADNCCQKRLHALSWLFQKFSRFEDHSIRTTGVEFSVPESLPRYWWVTEPKIQQITDPLLRMIGSTTPRTSSSNFPQGMNEGLHKAIHLSNVTKLITQVVVVGEIDQDSIDIFDRRPQPDGSKDPNSCRAYPTIFVFFDVMDAVEASKTMLNCGLRLPDDHPTWNPMRGVKTWNLNKKGLMLFVHAILSVPPRNNNRAVVDRAEKVSFDATMEEEAPLKGEETVTKEAEPADEAMKEDVEGYADDEDNELDDDEEEEEEMELREIRFPIMEGACSSNTVRDGEKPSEAG